MTLMIGRRHWMKIEQVPTFKRNVKRLKRKHYDIEMLKKVVKLIVENNVAELKRKHKLGIIKGTHPTVWYVHVDRNYNDDWVLCYRIENDRLLLLLTTGGHEVLKHIPDD